MVVGTRFVVVGEVLSLNGVGLGVACNWWVGGLVGCPWWLASLSFGSKIILCGGVACLRGYNVSPRSGYIFIFIFKSHLAIVHETFNL